MAQTFSRRLSILYRDLIRRTSTSLCSLLALDANQVQNFAPETHNARAPIQKSSHASLDQLKSRPHPQRISDIDFTLRYPYLAARHTIVLVHGNISFSLNHEIYQKILHQHKSKYQTNQLNIFLIQFIPLNCLMWYKYLPSCPNLSKLNFFFSSKSCAVFRCWIP